MQHLGLLSLALLIVGLTFTAFKLPGGLSTTFSQRVANDKTAELLYSLLFITALTLLYMFFYAWFVPNNDMPSIFLWFAAIAVAFQIACTWVPERGGTMTVVHRTLTGISGIALLPMVLLIAMAKSISPEVRVITWLTLIVMVAILGIALLKQRGFRYALLLQIGYYASFFAVVLLVTYA